MKKDNPKHLTLNRKTLFAFAGKGNSRNGESTETSTVTISLNSLATVLLNKK